MTRRRMPLAICEQLESNVDRLCSSSCSVATPPTTAVHAPTTQPGVRVRRESSLCWERAWRLIGQGFSRGRSGEAASRPGWWCQALARFMNDLVGSDKHSVFLLTFEILHSFERPIVFAYTNHTQTGSMVVNWGTTIAKLIAHCTHQQVSPEPHQSTPLAETLSHLWTSQHPS